MKENSEVSGVAGPAMSQKFEVPVPWFVALLRRRREDKRVLESYQTENQALLSARESLYLDLWHRFGGGM